MFQIKKEITKPLLLNLQVFFNNKSNFIKDDL